ncbi:hypothetical protein D9M70_315110 [compost metagenome]
MPPMKRPRSPNLDDVAIEAIVEILDGWKKDKLTWTLLIEQILLRLRRRYTRQALNNHARIKMAFTARKARLSDRTNSSPQKTPEQLRISRLEEEIQRLKMENNNLLEQFNRWVYNGFLKQIDHQMLETMNRPLPPIYRSPSKEAFPHTKKKAQ